MTFISSLTNTVSSPYLWITLGLLSPFVKFLPETLKIFLACVVAACLMLLLCKLIFPKHFWDIKLADPPNNDAANLIGKRYILAQGTVNQKGRIRIHDSMWTIRLDEDTPDLPKGARIEITGIDGTTLCAISSSTKD